jgi:glycosyltransferase involved in cell wall biosynthesis
VSNRVDYFIANSNFISKRIKKCYNRESITIYPPVNTMDFDYTQKKEKYYFTCSRMVPYKRIDLIVKAFSLMPDKTLIVIGDGPEMKNIKKIAKGNINLMGYQPFPVLKDYMERAKAFVFAAEEDFGIAPVEAQACGVPVIAYGKGGVLETVIEGVTGLFFHEQDEQSIIEAVNKFEKSYLNFDSEKIAKHAAIFDVGRFKEEIKGFVTEHIGKAAL